MWAAPGLAARQDNAIQRVAQFKIKRGLIYASDGKTVLAKNVARKKAEAQTLYFRTYPTHGFASQVVGYSTQGRSRAGIERQENAYLTAANANLGTIWDKLTDTLKGTTVRGNNLVLNLNVGAQKIAETRIARQVRRRGRAEPEDGRRLRDGVVAGATTRTRSSRRTATRAIIHSPSACPGSSSALLNRATSGPLRAGVDVQDGDGGGGARFGHRTRRTRSSTIPATARSTGRRSTNAGNPDQNGPEQFGNVNLVQAFQHSINAVFCDIGKSLGAKRVLDKAKDFGFYSKPPIELPSNEVAPSGLYDFKKHATVRRRRARSTRAASRSARSACS